MITLDITRSNEESEPKSVEECRRRNDWPKWKAVIKTELNSLVKRDAFGPVVQTPKGVIFVRYK